MAPKLIFNTIFPTWVIIIIITGFVVSLYFLIRRLKTVKKRLWALLIFLLRITGLFLIVLCLINPVLQYQKNEKTGSEVVFLIDTSQSMSINDVENPDNRACVSRLGLVKHILAKNSGEFVKSFDRRDLKPRFYMFDNKCTYLGNSLENNKLDSILPAGAGTNIVDALQMFGNNIEAAKLKGLVLFSDGADNSGKDAAELTGNQEVPVFCVGLGRDASGPGQGTAKDIEIENVDYKRQIKLGDKLVITPMIKAVNCPAGQKTIILSEDKVNLKIQSMTLEDNKDVYYPRLEFIPAKAGKFEYKIFVPPDDDEINKNNNHKLISVDVLPDDRDKILCLYGSLNWEYKFLRRVFSDDLNFDFQSILYVAENRIYSQSEELSSFPDKLEDINKFKLIILANLPVSYLSENQLKLLDKYVAEYGGRLAVLGGENAFSNDYKNENIAGLLPVKISSGGQVYTRQSSELIFRKDDLKKQLSSAGDLKNDFIPVVAAYNKGLVKKPLAEAWLANKEEDVILATQVYGKGKVLALATDATWLWSFSREATNASRDFHRKFWLAIIKYLTDRSEATKEKPVMIDIPKDRYPANQDIMADVYFYAPAKTELDTRLVISQSDRKIKEILPIQKFSNRHRYIFKLSEPGRLTISAEARDNKENKLIGQDKVNILIESSDIEMKDIYRNKYFLSSVSEATGGLYVELDEVNKIIENIKPRNNRINILNEEPLCNFKYIFLLLLAAFSLELFLRKLSAMP